MAYVTTNPPNKVSQTIAGNSIWHYSSEDVSTDVDDADYFSNGYDLGMKVGDIVFVIETDNSYTQTLHSVTVVTEDGAATVSAAT